MRNKLIAALLAAGLAGFAVAQVPTLFLNSPTGSETINVLGLGPQIESVTINTVRNTTGYQLTAVASGTIVTTTAVDNLILTAAQTGATTVDLPPSPADGQLFSLNNGTSSNFTNTITVATTDGSTIANGNTAANLGASGSQEWQYTAASKVWYRLR